MPATRAGRSGSLNRAPRRRARPSGRAATTSWNSLPSRSGSASSGASAGRQRPPAERLRAERPQAVRRRRAPAPSPAVGRAAGRSSAAASGTQTSPLQAPSGLISQPVPAVKVSASMSKRVEDHGALPGVVRVVVLGPDLRRPRSMSRRRRRCGLGEPDPRSSTPGACRSSCRAEGGGPHASGGWRLRGGRSGAGAGRARSGRRPGFGVVPGVRNGDDLVGREGVAAFGAVLDPVEERRHVSGRIGADLAGLAQHLLETVRRTPRGSPGIACSPARAAARRARRGAPARRPRRSTRRWAR